MWSSIIAFASGLISPITEVVKGHQARKAVKLEGDIAIAKAQTTARVKHLLEGQQADIKWENLSIVNSGWKDEYILLLLSIPLVMCFIPGGSAYVHRGFVALQQTPEWYRWAFMVAVGSSFGYRKIADFMSLKKGN